MTSKTRILIPGAIRERVVERLSETFDVVRIDAPDPSPTRLMS